MTSTTTSSSVRLPRIGSMTPIRRIIIMRGLWSVLLGITVISITTSRLLLVKGQQTITIAQMIPMNYIPYAIYFRPPGTTDRLNGYISIDDLEATPDTDLCYEQFSSIINRLYTTYSSDMLVTTCLDATSIITFDNALPNSKIYTAVSNYVDSVTDQNVLILQPVLTTETTPSSSPSIAPSVSWSTSPSIQQQLGYDDSEERTSDKTWILQTSDTIPPQYVPTGTTIGGDYENQHLASIQTFNAVNTTLIIEVLVEPPSPAPSIVAGDDRRRRQLIASDVDHYNDDNEIEVIQQQQQQQQHRKLQTCRRTVCYQSKWYINIIGCTRYCSKLRQRRDQQQQYENEKDTNVRRRQQQQPPPPLQEIDIQQLEEEAEREIQQIEKEEKEEQEEHNQRHRNLGTCPRRITRRWYRKGKRTAILRGRGQIPVALFYQYVDQYIDSTDPCQAILKNMAYVVIDLAV